MEGHRLWSVLASAAMRRILAGVAVAGAVAACVAAGQMGLARWARVLVPDQEYAAGNDTWPFQLVLLAWCSASAVVLGVAAARLVVQNAGWLRNVVVAAAGIAALAPLRLATGWASGAAGGDPAAAAGAVLLGALVGAPVGAAVLGWRAVARGAVVWVGWVWLNVATTVASYDPRRPGRDYVVPVDPLGMFTPAWPGHSDVVTMVAALSTLLPAALLGWWARRRAESALLFGVVVGPLLLVAVHLVVRPLPGGRSDGDHYSLVSDAGTWLLVAVLGLGAGAVGSLAGRGRTAGDRRPMAAGRSLDVRRAGPGGAPATAVMLLMVAASLLAAAALIGTRWTGGGGLAAGTTGLAFGAAAAHHRGRTLPPVAGAGCAVTGVLAFAVASSMFRDVAGLVPLGPWSIVWSLTIVGLIGALARGVTGAAWAVVAVGGLHAAAAFAAEFVTGPRGQNDSRGLIIGLLGLLSAAIALTVTRDGRHPADAPESTDAVRTSSKS